MSGAVREWSSSAGRPMAATTAGGLPWARASATRVLREPGRLATLALYHELALAPKPGLVSFIDTGSHADMDALTFMRSLFALRSYFPAIVEAGAQGAPFATLEQLGKDAELRMLAATRGINTHRGAIFTLGMLCAAAGRAGRGDVSIPSPGEIQATLLTTWGPALARRAAQAVGGPALSNGQRAARAMGLRSVGEEAALGFPVLFGHTLPALREARGRYGEGEAAMVQALMATIAVLDDTNLAHRGGFAGLRFAQDEAQRFLDQGGVSRQGWRESARDMHQRFVERRLSPGGAADLLGCAWWLDKVCTP